MCVFLTVVYRIAQNIGVSMDGIFNILPQWNEIRDELGLLLDNPPQDHLFAGKTELLAAQIKGLVDQNTDRALFSIMQYDRSEYGITHSVQSAVICDVYGNFLKWNEQERISTICAALTMNIAMLDLQQQLWQQQEPPTPEQQVAIRMHPVRGREMLEKLGVRNELWLRTVAEHHESADGKGYPTGTPEPIVNAAALNLSDRYCAKISRRRYRDAITPECAIYELQQLSTGKARKAVDQIVQAVGLYPPGTFVQLANGETAIVTARGEAQHTPVIFAVRNPEGVEIDPMPRDTLQPQFNIQCTARQIDVGTGIHKPSLIAAASGY